MEYKKKLRTGKNNILDLYNYQASILAFIKEVPTTLEGLPSLKLHNKFIHWRTKFSCQCRAYCENKGGPTHWCLTCNKFLCSWSLCCTYCGLTDNVIQLDIHEQSSTTSNIITTQIDIGRHTTADGSPYIVTDDTDKTTYYRQTIHTEAIKRKNQDRINASAVITSDIEEGGSSKQGADTSVNASIITPQGPASGLSYVEYYGDSDEDS
jgi:hypothetical protein